MDPSLVRTTSGGPPAFEFSTQFVLAPRTWDRHGQVRINVAISGVDIQVRGKFGRQSQGDVAVARSHSPFRRNFRAAFDSASTLPSPVWRSSISNRPRTRQPAIAGLGVKSSIQSIRFDMAVAGGQASFAMQPSTVMLPSPV